MRPGGWPHPTPGRAGGFVDPTRPGRRPDTPAGPMDYNGALSEKRSDAANFQGTP